MTYALMEDIIAFCTIKDAEHILSVWEHAAEPEE